MGGNHLYDCSYCEKNPYFLSVLGHDGPPQGMWTENLITNAPLGRCPLRTIQLADKENVREIDVYRLEVHPLWEKGHLLHPGGAGAQPARELAFMREFDFMKERVQQRYEEITIEKPEGDA